MTEVEMLKQRIAELEKANRFLLGEGPEDPDVPYLVAFGGAAIGWAGVVRKESDV